jgi:hypothetical protein
VAEVPAPVLTSPTPGSMVAGEVALTATSESAFVVFELERESQVVRRVPVAADVDGVFRDVLPTAGLGSRFSVRARACSGADLASCTTASEDVSVRGLSAHLEPTESWPSVLDPTGLGRVSLRAAGLGGYAATVSGLPGVASRQVHDGEVVDVELSGLADGNLEVWLRQCSPLNGWACTELGLELVVRRAPYLVATGADLFVSQNNDGLWETAVSSVVLDPDVRVSARWRITSGGITVAGPYELTADEIAQARSSGIDIVIDARARLGRPLPAGEYRFEVEATSTVPGFAKSNRVAIPLHVSTGEPIGSLTPNARVFFPDDYHRGVAHELRMSPRMDLGEVKYGQVGYRILKNNGQVLGGPGLWVKLDPADPVITWDGRYYKNGQGSPVPAPAGAYRIELIRSERAGPLVFGPVSAPFTLSRKSRDPVERAVARSARATHVRTLVQRGGQVRAGNHGTLRFRRWSYGQGPPQVTTFHTVRIPAHIEGTTAQLRIRGAWGESRVADIAVVTPHGRVVPIHEYIDRSRTSLKLGIKERWIGANNKLRFQFRWSGSSPGHVDKVVIRYWKYKWVS